MNYIGAGINGGFFMQKILKDKNGTIRIDNIQKGLLDVLVRNMQKKDSGYAVCRQFVYGKPYIMLVTEVESEMTSTKVIVTVALWPDENDATYYVTRKIPFYNKPENIHNWEDFCEAVSGGKAVFENDLLGNFFIGHIVKNKVYFDKSPTYFENLAVDKFIGRLDLEQAKDIVGRQKAAQSNVTKKSTSKVANLLEDDDED